VLSESKTQNIMSKTGKGKKASAAPIFLRKTYHMIETCKPEVAGWSDEGDMFIVKDPDSLAADVIPHFFKHSNFSSFVRQLNFYGFRKIKLEPIKINTLEAEQESKFWRFKHDKFQRGRPELLREIRKSNQQSSGIDPEDLQALRDEIDSLKSQVESLKHEMSTVSARIKTLKRPSSNNFDSQIDKRKRADYVFAGSPFADCFDNQYSQNNRRMAPVPPVENFGFYPVQHEESNSSVQPQSKVDLYPKEPNASFASISCANKFEQEPLGLSLVPTITPCSWSGRDQSIGSVGFLDNEVLTDIFGNESDDEIVNLTSAPAGVTPGQHGRKVSNAPCDFASIQFMLGINNQDKAKVSSPIVMDKLNEILKVLPADIQETVVKRIVHAVQSAAQLRNSNSNSNNIS